MTKYYRPDWNYFLSGKGADFIAEIGKLYTLALTESPYEPRQQLSVLTVREHELGGYEYLHTHVLTQEELQMPFLAVGRVSPDPSPLLRIGTDVVFLLGERFVCFVTPGAGLLKPL